MISAKGIIFDYGGTIDTNGVHWAEVIWAEYQRAETGISRELFREAYVHGERTLGKNRIIEPTHTFRDLLNIKIKIQFDYLVAQGATHLAVGNKAAEIAEGCYSQVLETLKTTCDIVEELSKNRPTVLVTNFYGNMPVVLKEFSLEKYFDTIVESSVVGIRKPDPRLFALGVEALGLPAEDIVVIGDSYRKDIAPARSLGCKAVWLKKVVWEEEPIEAGKEPTAIIDNLQLLSEIIR
ncbi:MAG: HAD family hydrolase [Bacteroidaceae bacterium]|nr:HAD family hydrolase [Bacteroidaceae bacterium]